MYFVNLKKNLNMKKLMILCAALALITACATNPLTGKKQIAISSEASLLPTAFQQYSEFMNSNKVITGTADAKLVAKVGDKIRDAAIRWMTAKGYASNIKEYKWEYKLVDDKAVNAWCMPGGKIAVFTGILPITKDEAGLATVMGHEVAHALLAHSRSRVDAAILQQTGAAVLGAATAGKSEGLQQAFQTAYGLGSNLGSLAYSRSHESEADHLGLLLMAIAGYNPDNAVPFWQRMAANGSASVPEFLSTHPSNSTRIKDIQKLIPTAKAEAKAFGKTF